MTETIDTRGTFLSTAAAVIAAGTTSMFTAPADVQEGANDFLKDWMTAWNARDAHALASLHTIDCVTVNRYGTLIPDRTGAEEALVFLLGPHGPFGDTVFQPMKLAAVRAVSPGVAILQASWGAPALGPNGKVVPGEFNQMMLSYTLVESEGRWKTTQIDAHNVEHMELPYSNPDQKK